ncbi:hypothetical protein C8R42DRAFT_203696 [Lentinula raphanica]|nr:hypothetical protein C8R42DRAFT_203696 [Lentinula raphanica]
MLSREQIFAHLSITPQCQGLEEQPSASDERLKLRTVLLSSSDDSQISLILSTPLGVHLAYGLAYTTGSALGSIPPTEEECLAAFTTPNKVKLTAGARAWSKHAHRSLIDAEDDSVGSPPSDSRQKTLSETLHQVPAVSNAGAKRKKEAAPTGWWGTPSGPVSVINERALDLFWKIFTTATWRNLHWLPYSVLVYEIRVPEGYGMRWSQDRSDGRCDENGKSMHLSSDEDSSLGTNSGAFKQAAVESSAPWVFRGFVEPMMENGHERGWRHAP